MKEGSEKVQLSFNIWSSFPELFYCIERLVG